MELLTKAERASYPWRIYLIRQQKLLTQSYMYTRIC